MALYISGWDGDIPQNGRVYVHAIRMTLHRQGDRCDVQLHLAPATKVNPTVGKTVSLQIPTSVHDIFLFGGDVILRADGELLTQDVEGVSAPMLRIDNIFLGDAAYAISG